MNMIWPHKYRGYNRHSRHWTFNKTQRLDIMIEFTELCWRKIEPMSYIELSDLYPNKQTELTWPQTTTI